MAGRRGRAPTATPLRWPAPSQPRREGKPLDRDGDENPVPQLVAAALDGDHASWNALVDRYTPLVLSVVRRHRLQGSDSEDVVQTVWLRLVENLGGIREPAALPGWIVTTTRNECLHVIRKQRLGSPPGLGGGGGAGGGGVAGRGRRARRGLRPARGRAARGTAHGPGRAARTAAGTAVAARR